MSDPIESAIACEHSRQEAMTSPATPAQGDARTFPILPGGDLVVGRKTRKDLLPSVPWSLVEPHRAQAMKNHGQTLERLAERQGLSFCELAAVLEDRDYAKMTDIDALAAIARHLIALSRIPSEEATEEDVYRGGEVMADTKDRLSDEEYYERNYSGHGRGVVITNDGGKFSERPMTNAELWARKPALEIAADIHKLACYAAFAYIKCWEFIAPIIETAMSGRDAEIAALRSQLAIKDDALAKLEWSGSRGLEECSWCGEHKNDGHHSNCLIALALTTGGTDNG